MSPDSAPLLSATSRYARVDQYHLSWHNLGWENVKYVERTRARRERKTQSGPRETEWTSALLFPKTPPVSRSNHSGQRALDRWANLLETLGVFSALSGEHGSTDGPQLVCRWPQVNYQESGRERWRLAQHEHANPLHFSRFSPDLQLGIEFGCVLDHFPDYLYYH